MLPAHTASTEQQRRASLPVLPNYPQDNNGILHWSTLHRVDSAPHMTLRPLTGPMPGAAGQEDGEYGVDGRVVRQVRDGAFVANFYTPKCLVEGMNTGNARAVQCANLYATVLLTVKDWAKTHEPELYRYIANQENHPLNTDYGVLGFHCNKEASEKFLSVLESLGGAENQRLLKLLLQYPDVFMEYHSDQSLDTLLIPGVGNPLDISCVSGSISPRVEEALTGAHGLDASQRDIPPARASAVPVVDTLKALADQLHALHAQNKIHGNLTLATLRTALACPEALTDLPDETGKGFDAYQGFSTTDKFRLAGAISRQEGSGGITGKADNHMLLDSVIRLFAEQAANPALLDELEAVKGDRACIGSQTPQVNQWLDSFVNKAARSHVKDSIEYPLFFSTEEISLADVLNWEALRSGWVSELTGPVYHDVAAPLPAPSLSSESHPDPAQGPGGPREVTGGTAEASRSSASVDLDVATLPDRSGPHEMTAGTAKATRSSATVDIDAATRPDRSQLVALRSVFARLDTLHRSGRAHGALSDELIARAVATSAELDEVGIPYTERTDLSGNCQKILNDCLSRTYRRDEHLQKGMRDIDWYYALRGLVSLIPEEYKNNRQLLSQFISPSLAQLLGEDSYVYSGFVNKDLTLEDAVDWDKLTTFLYTPELGSISTGFDALPDTALPVERLQREVTRFDLWRQAGGCRHGGLSAAVLDQAIKENRPIGNVAGESRLRPLYYPPITGASLKELGDLEAYAMLISIMHWSSLQHADWQLSHNLNYLSQELEKDGEARPLRLGHTVMGYRNEIEGTDAVTRWVGRYIKPEQQEAVLAVLKATGNRYDPLLSLPPLAECIDWAELGKSLAPVRSRQESSVAKLTDFSLETAPAWWRAACEDMERRHDTGTFIRDLSPGALLTLPTFLGDKARETPAALPALSERVKAARAEQKEWVIAMSLLFEFPELYPLADTLVLSDTFKTLRISSSSVDNWIEAFVKRGRRAEVRKLHSSYGREPVGLADAIDWAALEQGWNALLADAKPIANHISEANCRLLFPQQDCSEHALFERAFPDANLRDLAVRFPPFRRLLLENSIAEAHGSGDVPRLKACLLLHPGELPDINAFKSLAEEFNDTGLLRFLKQQVYFGSGKPNVSLNRQVTFTEGSCQGDPLISCRHFAAELAKHGKKRLKDFETKEGIKAVLPDAAKAEKNWKSITDFNSHRYTFNNDQADDLVRRVIDTMNHEGKTHKALVIRTDNHAVTLLINKKTKDGLTYYVLEYYDPNRTAGIMRKTFTDPASLRYSLRDVMGRKEDEYYIEQNKPYRSMAYDVDTAGKRVMTEIQRVIPCNLPAGTTSMVQWIIGQMYSRDCVVNWSDLGEAQWEALENRISEIVANDYDDFGTGDTRRARKINFLNTLLYLPEEVACNLHRSRIDPESFLVEELREQASTSTSKFPRFQP